MRGIQQDKWCPNEILFANETKEICSLHLDQQNPRTYFDKYVINFPRNQHLHASLHKLPHETSFEALLDLDNIIDAQIPALN